MIRTPCPRWVYVRRKEGERLYRVRFLGTSGTATLPGRGGCLTVENRTIQGIKIRVDGALAVRAFRPGTVLIREPKSLLLTSAPRSRRTGAIALGVLSVLLIGASSWLAPLETAATKQVQNHAETASPTPIRPTSTLPVKPAASAHLMTRIRVPQERPVESGRAGRAIRVSFLAGNLNYAEDLMGEVRARNHGATPRDLLGLASEIAYARCHRAYMREDWTTAIRACEEADREISHPKARRILVRLSTRARRLFLEAYVMETTNLQAALQRYRDCLAVAPTGDVYRRKAAEKLKWAGRTKLD